MSKDARSELITAIARRYGDSGRGEKTRILDEFVAVAGDHRKRDPLSQTPDQLVIRST